MKYKAIILLLTYAVSFTCLAATGGGFLSNGAGGRASGMGMAQVGIATDGNAAYWNPAGLAQVTAAEFNTMYAPVSGLVDQSYVNYAQALPNGVLAVSVISSAVNDLLETDYDDSLGVVAHGGDFSYQSFAVLFSAATNLQQVGLRNWSIGGNLKFINESLKNRGATGYGLDIGVINKLNQDFTVGLYAQNIISPQLLWNTTNRSLDSMPLQVKVGVGYQLNRAVLVAMDLDLIKQKNKEFNLGVDYTFPCNIKSTEIKVRGGLDNGSLTMGLGLRYKQLVLDYAISIPKYSYMEMSQYLSLAYKFPAAVKTATIIPVHPVQVVPKQTPSSEPQEVFELETNEAPWQNVFGQE